MSVTLMYKLDAMQLFWALLFVMVAMGTGAARASTCGDESNNRRLRDLIGEISRDAIARMEAGEAPESVGPELRAALRLRVELARAWEGNPLLSVERAPYFTALLQTPPRIHLRARFRKDRTACAPRRAVRPRGGA